VFTCGPRRAALVAASLACAVTAVGCTHPVHVPASGTLQVGLSDYRLVPDRLAATAGTLTLVAHNFGRMTHNLTVSSHGSLVASTRPIAPGATATLSLRLAPGRYRIASTILSDQALGEFGTLTVAG
jgi:hypothetical protein